GGEEMKILKYAAVALAMGALSGSAFAQERAVAEPGGTAGKWSTRTPVKPDNVWVAISGNTFGFPPQGIDKPHVKIFDKSGKLIKDHVGLGIFKSFAL